MDELMKIKKELIAKINEGLKHTSFREVGERLDPKVARHVVSYHVSCTDEHTENLDMLGKISKAVAEIVEEKKQKALKYLESAKESIN